MKLRDTIPWLLVGGLCASTAFNVHLVQRLGQLEQATAPREPAALPANMVKKLCLTKEQCEAIRGCSDT